jgi:hypothetical protein
MPAEFALFLMAVPVVLFALLLAVLALTPDCATAAPYDDDVVSKDEEQIWLMTVWWVI